MHTYQGRQSRLIIQKHQVHSLCLQWIFEELTNFTEDDFLSKPNFSRGTTITLAIGSLIVVLLNVLSSRHVGKTFDTTKTLYYILRMDAACVSTLSMVSFIVFVQLLIYPSFGKITCTLIMEGIPMTSGVQPFLSFWISLIR